MQPELIGSYDSTNLLFGIVKNLSQEALACWLASQCLGNRNKRLQQLREGPGSLVGGASGGDTGTFADLDVVAPVPGELLGCACGGLLVGF